MRTKVKVSPLVLKWARETYYGDRVEEVALKLGVEKELLVKLESTENEIPLSLLKKMSKIYKRHISVLLLDTAPKSLKKPKFRKFLDFIDSDIDIVTLRAIRNAQEIQQMTKSLMKDSQNKLISRLRKDGVADASLIAQSAIKNMNINQDLRIRGKDSREQLNIWKNLLQTYNIVVCEFKFPSSDCWGFSLVDDVCPAIVINRSTTYNARIFTLFHELGHIILNHSDVDFDLNLDNNVDGIEVWCNAFAGGVLLPDKMLINALSSPSKISKKAVINIANRFKISLEVVWRRLLDLNYISIDYYRHIHREMSSYPIDLQKKRVSGGASKDTHLYVKIKEKSGLFISTVFEAYSEKRIGYLDMMRYLNIKEIYLERLQRLMFT